jgi:ABC-type transport system involved in multi-copper enzyme maturation permease subunit
MFWYKTWLETRWNYLFCLMGLILVCSAMVFTYPIALKMTADLSTETGPLLKDVEIVRIRSGYSSYIWQQWFNTALVTLWPIFTLMIGSGGVVSEAANRSCYLTLSLPVTRRRMVVERFAVGVLEMISLAILPSLLLPLLSIILGHHYPLTSTIVYSLLIGVGGMAFFGFAFLLSNIFKSEWYGVVGYVVIFTLGMLSYLIDRTAPFSLFRIMSGESYFTSGNIPWEGIIVSNALAFLMFIISVRIVEMRDFN